MKAIIYFIVALFTINLIPQALAKDIGEVELKKILLDLDEYKNDKVNYQGRYGGFTKNPPPFLEKSGFDEDDEVIVLVGGTQLPVIAEEESVKMTLGTLKRGSLVKVSGKIKEAKRDPKHPATSGYYLEMKSFEVLKEVDKEIAEKFKGWRKGGFKGKALN
ncbi:MAG: hypothetical protein AAF558_01460 [Verrucomicrobiota bacterium]